MESKTKTNHYQVSDLKLQAFLRLMSPKSFIGVNKSSGRKVLFIFKDSTELKELANAYLRGEEFTLSPLNLGKFIDLGKSLIFENYDV